MIKETDDNIPSQNLSLTSTKDSLTYYKKQKVIIHVVLTNRRFYNGLVIEVLDSIMIFEDSKIGRIPIPLEKIFLIENFHEPGEENGKK